MKDGQYHYFTTFQKMTAFGALNMVFYPDPSQLSFYFPFLMKIYHLFSILIDKLRNAEQVSIGDLQKQSEIIS